MPLDITSDKSIKDAATIIVESWYARESAVRKDKLPVSKLISPCRFNSTSPVVA